MKKIGALIICMMISAVGATAGAEIKAGSYSVTPFAGYYLFEGNENLKETYTVGVRAGYNFTENLGLEGFLHYVPTEIKGGGDADVKMYSYGIEGLYHFMPDGKLVPFIAVGVGGIYYNSSDGLYEKNKLAVDYGAGLKYFITDDIALRADIRHVLPLKDNYNDLLFALGVNFAFGGEKKEIAEAKIEEPPAPVEVITDSDTDGIPDNGDKCPGTPAGVAVDKDGCPLDSDNDGVADYLDKCPGTPAGAAVDKDGCPIPVIEQKPVVIEKPVVKERVSITLNVEFDTAKSFIKKKYNDEIKKLADFMKDHPETSVVIEGNTDNVDVYNDPNRNIRLSQQRAESVRKYLTDEFSIDGTRISAIGHGPNKPIATNDTKEGREKNRRAEAVIETMLIK